MQRRDGCALWRHLVRICTRTQTVLTHSWLPQLPRANVEIAA
jgi:hypothetical protein